MRNISDNVEKMKTHILCSITFSENHAVNMEKYFTARQATDDNIILCMPTACWITKATDTRSEYLIVFFHSTNG
jgi:hypothetical protein